MKKFLLTLALTILAGAARAATPDVTFALPTRAPEPATNVTTVKSSDTLTAVSVTTQTPTSIVLDTTQMFRWVDVQNNSTTAEIVCGENSTLISTQPATLFGWVIAPSTGALQTPNSKKFDIVPGSDFFCQSRSVTAATRVTVMRGR